MLRKKSWYGLGTAFAVAAAVAVGMMAVGCGSNDGGGSTKPSTSTSVVGTWKMSSDDGDVTCSLAEDKSFEMKLDGKKFSKGNYEAASPNFTLTITHANGEAFNAKAAELAPPGVTIAIQPDWYTKDAFTAALNEALGNNGLSISSIPGFEENIEKMFKKQTGTYVLDGNTLWVTHSNGTDKFIKQ